MQKDHKTLNKVFAALAFLSAFILYLSTLPPTTSFWDPAERIATAWGLQIPHPPGPPLYLLLGRLFSMSSPEAVAFSINIMSALASSLTVMLLYLIIVRLVREYKGYPDSYNIMDKIGLYGGGLIGALAFAVSDSHWFTSIEAETYALSLTFTAFVVWLVLKWSENYDRPRSERWLVLIVYMFGLAFGVHLLSLLVIFFVGLIVYFKKYEFQPKSFIIAGTCSVLAFFAVYPITMIYVPSLAGDFEDLTGGLFGPVIFMILFVGIIAYGIYYTHQKKMRLANMVLLGYMLILVGYSSFSLIYIRSQVDPAIDQNSPDNIERFISFLKREQYGTHPILVGNSYDNELGTVNRERDKIFPRRHSADPRHMAKYAEYNSDWHFFWSYQVGHMYLRYFNWNFIGRDSDLQDAPWITGFSSSENDDNPAHNTFFLLPFLLGLFGMLYHFQRDWKRAFSVLVLFVATGLAIVFYLNQTPFQPRERDYSYTGSFFAFSIWMGLGVTGIIELIKEYLKDNKVVAYGALAACFLAVPVLMGIQTYDNNDRSLRYVASDYAYNLLNSTAPYAIIFTNGDNDTFPLWYLQEVEGIRTDVRVVNLSLLNTPWYIKQMKNKWNHESPPVPISLTDEEVDRLEDKYDFQRPQDFHQPGEIVISVDKELLKQHHEGVIGAETSIESSVEYMEPIGADGDKVVNTTEMSFEIPVDELDDEVAWDFEGTLLGENRQGNKMYYTRIQDDMILEILRSNQWIRPVYFAITVSYDSQMNLQDYFRLEGKAFRVVPKEFGESYGAVNTRIHGERLRSFRFRETDNEKAYFDENIRRMLDNYRTIFNRQASAYADINQPDSAAYWMRWGEDKIPFNVVEGNIGSMINYAYQYSQLDETDRALNITELAYPRLMRSFRNNMERVNRIENNIETKQTELQENGSSLGASGRRSLQNDIQRLTQNRQDLIREVSYDSSRLMIIQRIYYMSNMEDQANALAEQVESLTNGRIPFPTSEQENRNQVERMGMGL
ncbi:MAG: DUF2723 domain-containing protein [Balneolales bacterium]